VTLKINNRKILAGIAETIGETERIVDITVAIDKLDKIGPDKVNEELALKGVSALAIEKLQPILALSGSNIEKLAQIEKTIASSATGLKGVAEMRTIFGHAEKLGLDIALELDLTLARGLNYYTGAIFEVKANDVQIGSITGGGRYDDLTGIFGMPGVSGVGISFGADRIFDVMEQLNLFPEGALAASKVLFINFGEKEALYILPFMKKLREASISCELFPDAAKMKKQMEYANRKGIPYVVMAGESEMAAGMVSLKDMLSGEQSTNSLEGLLAAIR
jgi:histidyl-tRNA synthetase